ncbi:hypothetical protein [Chloroflexus sp.]|uniref:hypothetical protein n=1 Tax=Chloroflexus sp. TaxID=1904827 RepID=UPI002ADDD457|nr:hypothetical protein [Chloroflexus sp.]
MEYTTRQSIARELCERFARLADATLVVGGMLAPEALLTDFDPLELLVVADNALQYTQQSFMLQGIPVTIHTIALAALESLLREPDLRWPQWLSWLALLQPLVGNAERVQDWLAQAKMVPEPAFYRSILPYLPQLVFPRYSELRAATVRREEQVGRMLVPTILTEMHTALCLINRCWPTHCQPAYLGESFTFSLQPRDWPILAMALITAHELEEIGRLAGTLVGNYWQLLIRCGLNIEHHQTAASAPLSLR